MYLKSNFQSNSSTAPTHQTFNFIIRLRLLSHFVLRAVRIGFESTRSQVLTAFFIYVRFTFRCLHDCMLLFRKAALALLHLKR